MTHCALSKALLAMLPGAMLLRRKECDWHSATFSGVRIEIVLGLADELRAQAKKFEAVLADAEFSLPRLWVADIAVVQQQETEMAWP